MELTGNYRIDKPILDDAKALLGNPTIEELLNCGIEWTEEAMQDGRSFVRDKYGDKLVEACL